MKPVSLSLNEAEESCRLDAARREKRQLQTIVSLTPPPFSYLHSVRADELHSSGGIKSVLSTLHGATLFRPKKPPYPLVSTHL